MAVDLSTPHMFAHSSLAQVAQFIWVNLKNNLKLKMKYTLVERFKAITALDSGMENVRFSPSCGGEVIARGSDQ